MDELATFKDHHIVTHSAAVLGTKSHSLTSVGNLVHFCFTLSGIEVHACTLGNITFMPSDHIFKKEQYFPCAGWGDCNLDKEDVP